MPYNIHTIPRPRWIVTLVLVAVAAGIYGLSSSPGVEASGNPTNGAFTWFYRGAEMIEPSGTFFDVEAPAGSDYIVTADIYHWTTTETRRSMFGANTWCAPVRRTTRGSRSRGRWRRNPRP